MAIFPDVAMLRRIAALFPESQRAEVAEWLATECGDRLPGAESQGAAGVERIRCAVLKISGGSLDRLLLATDRAQQDWRDCLVAAGFAEDATAHLPWLAEVRSSVEGGGP